MTTDQLVEDMRDQGFFLDLDSRNPHDTYTTKYSARFWKFDAGCVEYVYADTIDTAIRLAATTVNKRHGLDLDVPPDTSKFVVWAYGILWGVGIILGIQIIIAALQ
jgi:hypothetical protein